MDFIFMLTRYDQTVEDCLEVMAEIVPVGLSQIGFKDVGVDAATLRTLNAHIKQSGATSYMEVVSTSKQACLHSARVAAEIGVDRLLGGTDFREVLQILCGTGIEYYPFPGTPTGHPTQLGGSPDQIAAHCREFLDAGCAGVDLLAYRATDADPLDLVRAARQALQGARLIVAGSIDSPARVRALAEAGTDAFTIGSAVFDGSFSPNKGAITSRLREVTAVCS